MSEVNDEDDGDDEGSEEVGFIVLCVLYGVLNVFSI